MGGNDKGGKDEVASIDAVVDRNCDFTVNIITYFLCERERATLPYQPDSAINPEAEELFASRLMTGKRVAASRVLHLRTAKSPLSQIAATPKHQPRAEPFRTASPPCL